MTNDDLRQADFSLLSVREMTPDQRAELKRRYQHFIANFQPGTDAKLPPARTAEPTPRKWVPDRKTG